MAPGSTSSWQLTAWLVLKEPMQADRHAQSRLAPAVCTASIRWIVTEQGTSSMLQSGSAAGASAAAEAGSGSQSRCINRYNHQITDRAKTFIMKHV